MKKSLLVCLILVFGASLVFSAAVKNDPNRLSDNVLAQYFNKRRNLDRYLQQGQYGPCIHEGKKILKDIISEDAYTAYCIAAAYASIEPDPNGDEDTVGQAIKYLDKAIEWGFRNVDILKTSAHFDNCRKNKDFLSIITYLEKLNKQETALTKKLFLKRIQKQIANGKPKKLEIIDKDINCKPIKADTFAGKPVFVVVLRPHHPGVQIEIPLIKKLVARAKEKKVLLLGSIYNYHYTDHLKKEAKRFVADNKLSFPCMPVEREWTKKYGVLNLPSLLLVNKKGEVIYTRNGCQEQWRLDALLDILAAQ